MSHHIPPISIWRCSRQPNLQACCGRRGLEWPWVSRSWQLLLGAVGQSVSPAVVKVCMLFISLHYGHVEIYNVYQCIQ